MGYPAMLWALAPLHEDFPQKWIQDHMIFNATLEKMVEKFQGINTLKLLKIWDPEDQSFYSDHRLTANGLQAFWSSIDSAFRHWDTFVSTKQKKKISIGKKPQSLSRGDNCHHRPGSGSTGDLIKNEYQKFSKFKHSDKYRWQKREDRRPLPVPPIDY